jgi:predicted esterase YcpF (UPF0227 family)
MRAGKGTKAVPFRRKAACSDGKYKYERVYPMTQKILYIHGFGSSGLGVKAVAVKKYFSQRGVPFLAPSLSYVPDLAIHTLRNIIDTCGIGGIVGSFLGGYYALYLAAAYDLRAVLINPALNAPVTLRRALPEAVNYNDLSRFEWNRGHLNMLEKYRAASVNESNILLMMQKGDEVLDYREALEILPNAHCVLEEGGSHAFDGIERHFMEIERFLLEGRIEK